MPRRVLLGMVVAIAAVSMTGCGGASTTTTTTTGPSTTISPGGPRAVLPPATVAPVSGECTLSLTHEADGNVKPLLCADGGVNVPAWQWYAKGRVNNGPVTWSETLRLGVDVTAMQVWQAMCADDRNVYGTSPLTLSAETLAAAYYGWHFVGTQPATEFERSGCSG